MKTVVQKRRLTRWGSQKRGIEGLFPPGVKGPSPFRTGPHEDPACFSPAFPGYQLGLAQVDHRHGIGEGESHTRQGTGRTRSPLIWRALPRSAETSTQKKCLLEPRSEPGARRAFRSVPTGCSCDGGGKAGSEMTGVRADFDQSPYWWLSSTKRRIQAFFFTLQTTHKRLAQFRSPDHPSFCEV